MDFRFAHLTRLATCVALSASADCALAQSGAASSGQAILFSTPAGEAAASNASAFTPPDSRPRDFADQFQAPVTLFNHSKPAEEFSLPSGGPAISGSQSRRLQKTLEDRQNWALLTPEEILGVTTPEKILSDDPQDKARQNPAERFLARQQTGMTNSFYDEDAGSRRLWSGDRSDGTAAGSLRLGAADAGQFLNRFTGARPDNNPFAAQNEDSSWFKPSAPVMAKPDPQRTAALDRFRQLLTTGSVADAPEKSSPGGKFLSGQALPDPNLQALPVVNRSGASYTPLSSGISKPTGLTPLPGIIQPVVTPVVTPSWAPQPPPWLSQTPQPFTVPQRKF